MNANMKAAVRRMPVMLALIAVCAAANSGAFADDRIIKIKQMVRSADVDLSQPEGGRRVYARLTAAARTVCGPRVGLEPVQNFDRCVDKALSNAVRSAHQPQVTLVYLESHTLQQAALSGIAVPSG